MTISHGVRTNEDTPLVFNADSFITERDTYDVSDGTTTTQNTSFRYTVSDGTENVPGTMSIHGVNDAPLLIH